MVLCPEDDHQCDAAEELEDRLQWCENRLSEIRLLAQSWMDLDLARLPGQALLKLLERKL